MLCMQAVFYITIQHNVTSVFFVLSYLSQELFEDST